MAEQSAHIAVANRNQRTINHLCKDVGTNAPWIVTVAFYKALHIVEAIFAADDAVGHSSDHDTRFRQLKTDRRYEHIYRQYSVLFRASLIARYLEDANTQVSCFDSYISPDRVPSQFLFHHLKQIEDSAQQFLSDPDALERVESARAVLSS